MFDDVYEIAIKSNDFEELKRKLETLHLDARAIKNGFFVTVGSQLAIEGKDEKVEWMRKLGARVNAIVQGYALAGNHEKQRKYSIDFLLTSYLKERMAVEDSSGVTKNIFTAVFFLSFNKVLHKKQRQLEPYNQH